MIFNFSSLIPAISCVLYIIFTIFGLSQVRKEKILYSFIFYMFMMTLWSFGSFMMHANTGIYTPLIWNRIMVIGMLGGPITIFHSLLDMAKAKEKRFNFPLYIGYFIYIFLLVLNFSGKIVSNAWFEGDDFFYKLANGAILAYSLSYLYLLLTLIFLSREFYKAKNRSLQRKLQFPIYGVIIMFLGVLVNLYEPLGKYPIDLLATTINAIFIFYAIYHYKLLHYSALVLRGILYFILVMISSTVFYGIFWIISNAHISIPFQSTFTISLLLGLVAAIIFQPLRKGTLSIIEKLYFGRRFESYKGLREFSDSLTSIVDLNTLGELTTKKIVESYHLNWAAMLVLDYSSRNYELIGWQGMNITDDERKQFILERDSSIVQSFTNEKRELYEHPGYPEFSILLNDRTLKLKPSLILSLSFKERVNGYLLLGESEDRDYYNQFNVETLEILRGHCSVTLENGISFERLKKQQARLQTLNTELTMSRNKLEAFFDGITSPISIQDINHNIIMVNYAATKYFHTGYEDLIGKKCYNAFFQLHKPCKNCMAQDCLHTQLPFAIELEKPSNELIFNVHFYPISVPASEDKLFLEFFMDITRQKKLQAELIQSEKLAGIGILASGIAHEINNPLGGILGTAEIMREQLDPDSSLFEYASDIIEYSKNAAAVIKDLNSYSRKEQDEISFVDIIEVLETSLRLAKRGMDFSQIVIKKNLEYIPEIKANQNSLQQVFLNLIVNAVQSMPLGGTLWLECKRQGWNAYIAIKDTGTGIDKEHLQSIFDPFYTTKKQGQGTGLGLSITHQILSDMGGRININSEIDHGTEMQILLPIESKDILKIRFVHVKEISEKEDVFYLQRKILVGEKGYREESIGRMIDNQAYHILAYKGLQPVGTVSCLTADVSDKLPLENHFKLSTISDGKRCAEISRLAVVKEERGSIVSLGLMTLAYLFARIQKTERLFLDVFADEKKQAAMYQKLGFQKIGHYSDPLAVDVMMLDHRSKYEQKAQRMEHFVKPFMSRLVQRLDFEESEKAKFLSAVDDMVKAPVENGVS